jgi:hypothetical protein
VRVWLVVTPHEISEQPESVHATRESAVLAAEKIVRDRRGEVLIFWRDGDLYYHSRSGYNVFAAGVREFEVQP